MCAPRSRSIKKKTFFCNERKGKQIFHEGKSSRLIRKPSKLIVFGPNPKMKGGKGKIF